MARHFLTISTPKINTGTDEATLLQIAAPANQKVVLHALTITGEGTNAAASKIPMWFERQKTAGTGGTAITPVRDNSKDTETIQTTAQHKPVAAAWSAEPTDEDASGIAGSREQIAYNPSETFTFGRGMLINGGERLALKCHAPAAADIRIVAKLEE